MTDKKVKLALESLNVPQEHVRVFETLRTATRSPFVDTIKSLQENSPLQKLLQDAQRYQDLLRVAEGPLAELKRAGILEQESPLRQELERAKWTIAAFEARFQLPEVGTAARLIGELRTSPLADILERYTEQTSSLRSAMESMRTPWLDTQATLKSVGGFAELQGIGGMLARLPSFDDRVSNALRVDLGDWRDRLIWPEKIFTDLAIRSQFYTDLGFDPALTDFPAQAFQESVSIAGLRHEPPPLLEAYGAPIPPLDDDEAEAGLTRTNEAHDWLQRLETQLRRFIDEKMTRSFGPDWPKHRLPNDLYDQWRTKQQRTEQEGRRFWPLISYADFTDYERVICKKDNWREVFAPCFGRTESVRETFQRLYPIRLDTMHARPITQDDELLLYVETRRLIKVILV